MRFLFVNLAMCMFYNLVENDFLTQYLSILLKTSKWNVAKDQNYEF